MITDVWVDKQRLDLYSDTNIRHTFQVNDVAEVKDRQASFTNSFTIPRTPNNIQIFGGLGISSDTSRIPYQKPSCQVKIDGFDLIVKGWLNVTETDDEYKIYIYSGIINFFKAIDNLTIGNDLDLSEINHEKNVDNVIGSYLNPNYKYLIADYNGKTHYGTNNDVINIDYLQPSVKVSYLWEKVHKGTEKLYNDGKYPVGGFPIAGDVFSNEKFQNLFLTYPKPTDDKSIEFIPVLDTTGRGGLYRWSSGNPYDYNSYCHIISFDGVGNNYTIPKTGRYRISIEFNLKSENPSSVPSPFAPFSVYMSKNQEGVNLYDRIPNSKNLFYIDDGKLEGHDPNNYIFQQDFLSGDILTFFFYFRLNGITINYDYKLKIDEVDSEDIDFSEELKEFSITDFVKEVVNQIGLTMFSDKHSNTITYKTINERINNSKIIDWSEKYIERESEEYVANSYAQRNSFEYQYNDKEGTYNNGFIFVDNKNLEDKKTVFKSKTYSPEQEFTKFFLNANRSENVNIFKFYDKEVNEDKTKPIKYKPLQKRYYFIRGEQLPNEVVKIGSEVQNKETNTTGVYLGNFSRLDFESILNDNYKDFEKILNDSRIHNISLNLNIIDLYLLDLDKLYYFSQEQQYYILNKLQYDNKNAKGEFVRVKFSRKGSNPEEDNEVSIKWIDDGINSTTTHSGYDIILSVKGIPKELIWQRRDKGGQWVDVEPVTSVQKRFEFVFGQNQFRVKYINGVVSASSNVLTYEKTLEVDPNKCYEFDLKSPVPKTVTVVYKNFDNIEITKELIFYTAGQVITISGKQLINTGGIDDIIQRTVPCPVFECHRYYISTVGGSGDDLTVTWTDCNGVERTDTQYSNAPGTTLSLTICAREGQFSHNSRNDARDEGLCS
jgi:hypothetical protein